MPPAQFLASAGEVVDLSGWSGFLTVPGRGPEGPHYPYKGYTNPGTAL